MPKTDRTRSQRAAVAVILLTASVGLSLLAAGAISPVPIHRRCRYLDPKAP